MRSIHWRIGLRTTGNPPIFDLPSNTSSLASTVPNPSHQLTGASEMKARRFESRWARCSSGVLSSGGQRRDSIGSALLVSGLNHELYSFKKIHWVHRK